MHRSLELLRISEDENELRSRSRLWRLFWSKNRGMILVCALFLFFAAVALYGGYEITVLEPRQLGRVMAWRDWAITWAIIGVLASGAAIPAAIFGWIVWNDPIPRWIQYPNRYEVVPAVISKAEYVGGTSGKKGSARMRVTIRVGDSRERLEESFDPSIWVFARTGEDQSLQGKRPRLPLQGFAIRPTDGKGRSALVGIQAGSIDQALELIRAKRKRRFLLLLVFLGALVALGAALLKVRGYV